MRDAYDYTKKLRGLVPGPHRIWLANPRLSKTIVSTGAYYQTQSTLTKVELATNVINGRWLAACRLGIAARRKGLDLLFRPIELDAALE